MSPKHSPFLGLGFTRLKDGRVMCQICFEYKQRADLFVDSEGTWDVCKGECAVSAGMVNPTKE